MMCRKDWSRFCCELCEKGLKVDASEEERAGATERLSETLRLSSPDVADRYDAEVVHIDSEKHREFILNQVRQRIETAQTAEAI